MAEDELNLGELADMADASGLTDAASIKQALPILYVLEQSNVIVTAAGDRFTFFCPFHEDKENPAGSVFGETLTHWSCWAGCGSGDVIDLIQKFAELEDDPLNFLQGCDRARGYVTTMVQNGWSGPTQGAPRKEVDIDTVKFLVDKAQHNDDYRLIDELISEKRRKDGLDSNRFPVEFLVDQFGLGVGPVRTKSGWRDEVIMPYYDAQRSLLTYKHRTAGSKAFAPSGAFPKDLYYNMWRTDMLEAPILLVEGESDTWNAQYEVGDTYRVLGLATGVNGSRPVDMGIFKDKDVLIAFDGDDAGRKGAQAWAGFLKAADCNIRVVPIPEGKDVSAIASSLRHLCSLARPLIARPAGIIAVPSIGYRRSGETDTTISNFVFQPVRELVGETTTAYEGILLPGGEKTLMSSGDLRNRNTMVTWALRQKRYWSGSDRDVAILLGMMQADSTYLPIGHSATVAGLHNKHFVWPGGVIGPDPWTYVPPPADSQLDQSIFIAKGAWEPEYIHVLRDIHKRQVTDPILAWLAVAPLRSLLKEFPILAISGPHGSGKTRTLETLVTAFTGTYIANTLTGTTPHAVISSFAATNGFPEIFEEYRNGAREEAKVRFEQLARDAYTQQKSQIGGMKGNWAELTSIVPSAPVIVSGEDMFSEGSHVERMILIQMFRDGQNPKAFETANRWKNNGLPYAYLTWLHRSLMDGSLDTLAITPAGGGDLGPRQRINIGILHFGWKLLRMFMQDAEDTLSDPDFNMIESELREANSHTPIEDAIYHCLSESAASSFCRIKEGKLQIRMEAFVGYVNEQNRRGDLGLTLPGRTPSIKKYLQMKYGATEQTDKIGGLIQTFMTFPYEKIAR